MGYTHYFTQLRSFTTEQWVEVRTDIEAILKEAEHNQGIPLANGHGEPKTRPVINASMIAFNGLGDDSHETLLINRAMRRKPKYPGDERPNLDFCKTARKPYDAAVTAVLCYLSTVTRQDDSNGEPIIGTEAFTVASDGDGSGWVAGLELARKALPRKANQLDIPMDIMRSDRWCAPWVSQRPECEFEVRFCVNGLGYVLKPSTGESYCFNSHVALAKFLDENKRAEFSKGGYVDFGRFSDSYGRVEPDIWNATGCFDGERNRRLGRAQNKVLQRLFPVDAEHAKQPPAYVRPGEMPNNAGREFCYDLADLLKLADAA